MDIHLEKLRYRPGFRVWINDIACGNIKKETDLQAFLKDREVEIAIVQEQAQANRTWVGYVESVWRQPVIVNAASAQEAQGRILAGEGELRGQAQPYRPVPNSRVQVEEWTYHHQRFWGEDVIS